MKFEPLKMPPIQSPIDLGSVAAVIGGAGLGILLLWLGVTVAMRRLARRERSPLRILGRWIEGLLG